MSFMDAGDEFKVTLAMAAWRSYARHQGEAQHWHKLFEQRIARLSEEERAEFLRQKDTHRPTVWIDGIDWEQLTTH